MTRLARRSHLPVDGQRIAVVSSGFADGPAQPLVRFFSENGVADVIFVSHPLTGEGPAEHRVDRYLAGVRQPQIVHARPNRPPFTYAFDPITPLHLPRVDTWIGFNCLATAQGLARRRVGLVQRVVHWNVDFVPDRFGNRMLNRLYTSLDRACCTRSNSRVELSQAALESRVQAYAMDPHGCPVEVIPMGTWIDAAPKATALNLDAPRVVFLGHLVERMGVPLLLDALAILVERGISLAADIVGGGPLLADLDRQCAGRGLSELVTRHGFVADFDDVAKILSRACIAVAPYQVDETSFSRFADPGKLKAYLGAALPILLTDVPPNAQELAQLGGAEILPDDAVAFANAIQGLLQNRQEWLRRHAAAQLYAQRFDWGHMFSHALPRLGISM